MRADKDLIARDLAGVERLVAFGSDVPDGWEVVRDAAGGPGLADNITAPAARGNVDAARDRAQRLGVDHARQADRATAARQQAAPVAVDYADLDASHVEDLQAEADRREITVEGTGKDGRVVKGDLVTALQAAGAP